jgi:hypothetical protein
MSKQLVEVISVEDKSGVKNGKPWAMSVLGVVVTEGATKFVGEMVLPKGHAPVVEGKYIAETKLGRNFEGKVSGVLEKLTPWQGTISAVPPGKTGT